MSETLPLAGGAVAIAAVASHAFHSWLKMRTAALLESSNSATIVSAHNDLLKEFDKFRIEVKNFMGAQRGR